MTPQFGIPWTNKSIEILILLNRRDYWEADSETELALANGSGSGTGGRGIANPHGAAVFNDTTVSFSGGDTIADSGNGFAIFGVGDVISLRGSTSNDGIYTVLTAAAAEITVNELVVNEAAGDDVFIYDMINYVHIDSAAIGGVLPAPLKIKITNNECRGRTSNGLDGDATVYHRLRLLPIY